MRKDLLAVAIILLLAGVITISVTANVKEEKIIENTQVARKTASDLDNTASSWSISGNFTKGRKLHVIIQPGKNWMAEPAPGYDYLDLPVSISDPQGGETRVKVTFTTDPFGIHDLQIESVEMVSDGGGLTFEESNKIQTINGTDFYNEAGGIVNYYGVYNVTVYRSMGVTTPPSILGLDSLLIEVEYPYWFVTVSGAGLIVIGVSLLIWVRKSPQRKRIVKRNQRS
jgi:type II secretory pathway pseudopilin PulG